MATPDTQDQRRNKVLDRWAKGELCGQIASALRITKNQVIGLVRRARNNGDARAVERGNPVKRKENSDG